MRGVMLVLMLALVACGGLAEAPQSSMPESVSPPACDDAPTVYLGGYDMGLSNRAQGLWTNPNIQTDAPDGANDKAENVELDRSGLARPRVGQERFASDYPVGTQRFRAGTEYQGYSFEFASAVPGASGTLYRRDLGTGALTSVLSMSPPAGVMRPRFAEANGDLYVTTSEGLRVFDGPLATPTEPGVPRALDIDMMQVLNGTGVPAEGEAAAFRVVLGYRDTENKVILGAPSGRWVADMNEAQTPPNNQPRFSMTLPAGLPTGAFVRLYRTPIVPSGTDPGDTMFLSLERPITSTELSVLRLTVASTQPDALLGDALYTNATQEGVLGANEQPPITSDALVFNESLLTANVTGAQQFQLRMIGVPVAGTSITVAGLAYTAVNSNIELGGVGTFSAYSNGTVSQNIERTTRSLVASINRRSGASVYARYLSSTADVPGIFNVYGRSLTTAAFTLQSAGLTWEPVITTAVSSAPEVGDSAIYVSKVGQPYAFPRYSENRLYIGRSDRPILRIVALRRDVFAFKDGEGIFKLTPVGDEWLVEQMSQDANLLIPESVAVMDNQILAYTTRGLVSVDASGVTEIDEPVRNYTEALSYLPPAVVQAHTFAATDPSRLCYWLWFPETAESTTATRALTYNARANPVAWTERTDAATGGYVGAGGTLYLGEPGRAGFTGSRRTGTLDDFQGPDGEAYTVRLSWPNRAEGMPGQSKHYRQARLYFEKPVGSKTAPLPVTWLFTNDYAKTSPPRTNQVYGLPYSTMEPDPGYQRTSDIGIEVSFPVQRAYVVVKGVEEMVSSAAPVRMGRQ